MGRKKLEVVVDTGADRVQARAARTAVEIFALNERTNQLVLEHLEESVWRTQPVGGVRSIAAIFAHVHNVRCKWVRLTAPRVGVPVRMDRGRASLEQAQAGLAESAERCGAMLALADAGGLSAFRRDGWARPWPPGAMEMVGYMVAHEAHHRGQVCLLAHQMGHPLPAQVGSGIWAWERLWR